MAAHVARRHVAGIDRRVAGGEQRDQRRLLPLQMKYRFTVAVGGHLLDIMVPDLSRIGPQLVRRFAEQQTPSAGHVLGREGLPIMPLDAVPQLELQLSPVLAEFPGGRKIGHDRLEAVLLRVLVVDDEVVEDPHHRQHGRDRRLLEDRHAGRAVAMIDLEDTALLLRECRDGDGEFDQQAGRRRGSSEISLHDCFAPARTSTCRAIRLPFATRCKCC